jgi:DnaJ-class molecular chaperone
MLEPKRVMCPYCQGSGMVKETLPFWKKCFKMALYILCTHCNGTGRANE